MSLQSKIESLITACNATTGESRTDLTAGIQDLVDGYGSGGGTEANTDTIYIYNLISGLIIEEES